MVIRLTDRVAAVLARDERLIEVFVSLAPTFEKLRNPAMRKVMARLVTVEQAARVAGIDPLLLIERLNAALDGGGARLGAEPVPSGRGDTSPPTAQVPSTISPVSAADRPAAIPPTLAAVPEAAIVDIDVRPDLRRGEEPFSKIMAARRRVPPGGVLRVRVTFEPVPLYAVLGKQGFEHWTERLADDDWRVWFYSAPVAPDLAVPPGATRAAEAAEADGPASPAAGHDDDVVVLDVRGLEPPEPMLRTLEALERLPRGKTLVQLNVRVPQFLLPQLAERGFTYEVREQGKDLVRIFIRHSADDE